jgi:hypothetical protein
VWWFFFDLKNLMSRESPFDAKRKQNQSNAKFFLIVRSKKTLNKRGPVTVLMRKENKSLYIEKKM